jgi:glutamate/tyrosine decarboxylase-like PLP-dependent enzyme
VEHLALSYVLDLLAVPQEVFPARTLVPGATSANVLGLALGREAGIRSIKGKAWSVAELGSGGVDVDIFCAGSGFYLLTPVSCRVDADVARNVLGAHASITKAAAILGIGRARVFEIVDDTAGVCAFDIVQLEERLKSSRHQSRAAIIVASVGEVNTVPLFGLLESISLKAKTFTKGGVTPQLDLVRRLCDRYGAWFHVDAGT